MTTKKTTKKTTTKAAENNNKAFTVKLSKENLEKCIAAKMSPADIAKKYDVKINTVITKFNKIAGEKAAKEAGIEEFCMATSRTPNEPKVNKFNSVLSASMCSPKKNDSFPAGRIRGLIQALCRCLETALYDAQLI